MQLQQLLGKICIYMRIQSTTEETNGRSLNSFSSTAFVWCVCGRHEGRVLSLQTYVCGHICITQLNIAADLPLTAAGRPLNWSVIRLIGPTIIRVTWSSLLLLSPDNSLAGDRCFCDAINCESVLRVGLIYVIQLRSIYCRCRHHHCRQFILNQFTAKLRQIFKSVEISVIDIWRVDEFLSRSTLWEEFKFKKMYAPIKTNLSILDALIQSYNRANR